MSLTPKRFAQTLLTWFDSHGRKNLPWQQSITSYGVWISEIMLQQTQVSTVIPYFQNFIKHFPNVHSLANASEDEVLQLWSGLGYYSRARNLHRSAQLIVKTHDGELPRDSATLQSLPGIGRSTAGAILAIASGQRAAILDGNVKRVLTRFHALAGWPGKTDINQQLWAIAERYTPKQRIADYTQAIMDLGATICTRTQPACASCPLEKHCQAHLAGQETAFPTRQVRKILPIRFINLLLLCDTKKRKILLTKRPPIGIWGGLWSLPECAVSENIAAWCERHHLRARTIQAWPSFRHTFSHFHLEITPVYAAVEQLPKNQVMDSTNAVWYKIGQFPAGGLATPIKRLLQQLLKISGADFHDSVNSLPKIAKISRRTRTPSTPR